MGNRGRAFVAQRSDGTASEIDPAAAGPGGTAAAEFSGDLAESPLPELLYRLHRMGATGVLVVQHEGEDRAIQLRNGSPIAVASNRGAEALEDFLVRTKRISGAEHEAVMERVEAGLGSPREILVSLGAIDLDELEAAIGERAAEPLLEGFGWSSGSYRFEPRRSLGADRSLDLERSPARLLFEGALHWAPSEMVRELLGRRAPFYVSRVERPPYGLEELPERCPPESLAPLLGDRSVGEVLGSGEIEERILYGLIITRFVEVHPAPVLLLEEVLAPAPAAARRPAPSERLRPAPAPAQAASRMALQAERAAAGAEPDLPAAEQRQPERQAEDGASRALEAESWFRKGETSLRRKRHVEAAEAFGMAAHLDPEAGEYRAYLGYALHLANPRNELVRREALEHIAQGIKLSPGREKPLLFLGRVFKAAGDLENARKVFRRALKIKPDCHDAQVELRLLVRAASKPRSLLDRLLGR
jgi:hypothetical protein